MAKGGLFGGRVGVGTPFNPGAGGGGGIPPIFSRGQGGILPERGSQRQLDLVSMLVQSGLGAAQQSGNPLVSLLAPLAGSAALSRSQGLYDRSQQQKQAETRAKLEGLLGNDPRTGQILDILGDSGAPDYAQSIASSLLRGQPGVSAGGSSTRGGGGASGAGGAGNTAMRDALLAGGDLSPEQVDGLISTMSDPNATADQRRMAREILRNRLGGDGSEGSDDPLSDLLAEPEPTSEDDGPGFWERIFGGDDEPSPPPPREAPVTPLAQPGAANPSPAAPSPRATPTMPSDPATPQPRAPKKGTVEDGYEFQGGDPSDPKNWKKVP